MASKKQIKIAKALFQGRLSEQQIMKQYNIRPAQMKRWIESQGFQELIQGLRQEAMRETGFIIARFGPLAAMKLAQLLESEKPEVARKAALNVIDRCIEKKEYDSDDENDENDDTKQISDEQMKKMILTLAKGFK